MRKYPFFFFYYPRLRFEHGRHGGKQGWSQETLYSVSSLLLPLSIRILLSPTYTHTFRLRSRLKKKKKNKNKKKKTERKSRQTNLSKNKKKGRTTGYTRHDTNFCSGTSARSQCVDGLWSKETSRSETVVFIRLVSYQLSKPVSLLYLSTNILYIPLGT